MVDSKYSTDSYNSLMLSLFECITHSSSLFMGKMELFAIVD